MSTAAVPAKASTASRKLTETGIEEMKAKVESERKRLREEKDLAAEEKSHIQVELEKHEKELAQVRSLTQLFSCLLFHDVYLLLCFQTREAKLHLMMP